MVRVRMLPSLQSSTKAEAREDFRTPEMVQLHKAIQEGKQQGALGRTFATGGISGKKAQSIMKRAFQHCCLSRSHHVWYGAQDTTSESENWDLKD